MNKVQRNVYLEKLKPFIGKPVIKILTGMRRVGKSELLTQLRDIIISEHPETNCIFINKELRAFDFIQDNKALNDYVDGKLNERKAAVFIDEVQEIVNWEKSIASYLAEGMDIYITGSNAHLLSSDLATLLSGRYVEIPVYTLSFNEFLEFRKGAETAEEAFQLYLKFGGLPGLHAFEFDENPTFQYLDAIFQSILLKDVVQRHHVRNVALLEDISKFLFDNIGNLSNANTISKYLKSQKVNNSVPTILSQIHHLSSAYLVHRVRQYDLKGKQFLEINDKFFTGDLGIRHACLGYRQDDISGVLENLVFLELLRMGYNVSVGRFGDKEVDFVCDRKEERIYLQVCYLMPDKKTADREFAPLEAIRDNFPKCILSLDPMMQNRGNGIRHLNILQFLQVGFQ
jgi:predicted AAA+ superfamily ATPase